MMWAFYLVAVTSFQNSTPSADYSIYFRLDKKESASAPWYYIFLATTLPPIFCARSEYNQHSILEPVERAEKIPIQKIKVLLQNPKSKPKIYIYLNN